jgi:ADP-heptose:LPS heptosyltransferase
LLAGAHLAGRALNKARVLLDGPAQRLTGLGALAPPAGGAPVADKPDLQGVLMALRVTGGIGDHLIAARYVRDLLAAVGAFRFDIYSPRPQTAAWVFSAVPQFNRAYDEYFSWHGRQYFKLYPISLWVSQFIVLNYETVQWSLLNRTHPGLARVCETADRFRHAQDMNEIMHAHPRLDGLLGTKAKFMKLTRHDLAHAMSGIGYGGARLDVPRDAAALAKFGLAGRRYITIHNGFDAEFQTVYGFATSSTKVYPHFSAVLDLVRAQAPDTLVVQIGSTTSTRLAGVDVQLIDRTNLAEVAAILAGAVLHIDNESGLVHLAACMGTRSCVVFGPTPPAYFGYEANLNIAPHTCGECWWTTKDWMTRCPMGFDSPKCLSDTPPSEVAGAILGGLNAAVAA